MMRSGFMRSMLRLRTKDRHKAPTSTPPFPLSLQEVQRLHFPIRSSKFIRIWDESQVAAKSDAAIHFRG